MRQYFKGYYFKCSTGNETVAFIPERHVDGKESRASLQIITNDQSLVIPYTTIKFNENDFKITVGHNFFSKKGISFEIDSQECSVHGKVKFGPFQSIKYDIMGPFQFIPSMQCKHTVVSMRHSITGKINVNGTDYCFADGVGYIEGDRGSSFPKEYLWTQCHFPNGSIMLSVADIPLMGLHFNGIIGIIMIAGKEYRIATYLGAKVISIADQEEVIKQGNYVLTAKLIKQNHQNLNAPVNGKMSRVIRESAACEASYQFRYKDETLLEFTSKQASFEFEFPQPQ